MAMNVTTAYLIQKILSPTGPSAFSPAAPAPTRFSIGDILNPAGPAAEPEPIALPRAA
jgi:hypothetical protein